jgi:hypothetical protein
MLLKATRYLLKFNGTEGGYMTIEGFTKKVEALEALEKRVQAVEDAE